jgi:tyrosinase
MDDTKVQTRYQRVQQILGDAAGGMSANPRHETKGRFWELPRDQFVALTIYGVELIPAKYRGGGGSTPSASAGGDSCCSHESAPAEGAACCASDASSSFAGTSVDVSDAGLIKAIRGLSPFDGSHFPRMPQGRPPVPEDGIQYIERWIADGCPGDEPHRAQDVRLGPSRKALGLEEHEPTSTGNLDRASRGEIKLRKNIELYTPEEVANLRKAIAILRARDNSPTGYLDTTSYGYWARIHGSSCQHGWEQFLTWHRAYLYEFELLLQDAVPGVTLPYWDWTMDKYKNGVGGVIPAPYAGATLPDGTPNSLWVRQRWPASFPPAPTTPPTTGSLQNFGFHYPTKDDISTILAIPDWRSFGGGPESNQSFGALSMNPHNTIHIWSGGWNPANVNETGYMENNLTAAFDPIFWAHHGNVDRLFAEWQSKHPGANPHDLTDVLSPLNFTPGDVLSIHELGYDYAADTNQFPTDPSQPYVRFKSVPVAVPDHFSPATRARVRLHRIRRPAHSFFIHVFLNQPDADESTPIENNPNYAGFVAIFGHGDCVGSTPDHCAPYLKRRDQFDQRGRSHNAPQTARMKATQTAQRLVAAGAKTLQVSFVVIHAGPPRADSALHLDAVSLDFKD